MNIKRIIKLKFLYLMNKSILIVFFVIFFLIVILFFLEGKNDNISYNEALELYNYNSYLYLKIIMIFFSVYLFTYSISVKNDFLIYLLLPLNVSRTKSIISTILLNVLILFIMFIFLFIAYNFIGFILIDNYVFKFTYLFSFFNIYLICLIYGIYSMILMLVLKNNFVIILVITIFIISNNYFETLNKISLLDSFILLFLPSVNFKGELYLNYISYFSQLFSTNLLLIYIYQSKDLNF